MLQRLLTYLVGTIVMLCAGLFAAPIFMDLDKYKADFSTVIKDLTGVSPNIVGNVHVSFFPIPTLSVGEVSVNNADGAATPLIFSADGVEATFTFLSMVEGKFDPKSMILLHPRFEIEKMPDGDMNWEKLLETDQKPTQKSKIHLPEYLEVNNGTLVYRSHEHRSNIDYITAKIKVGSAKGPFNFQGKFLEGATNVNFKGDIGSLTQNSDAKLNINADSFDFNMKGSYKTGGKFDMRGTADLAIKDAGKFADEFLTSMPIFDSVNSSEPMTVKGEFLISDELTSFNQLVIDSESIQGKGRIDALYSVGKGDNLGWDVALDIDKVNLDTLRKSKEPAAPSNPDEVNYSAASRDSISFSNYNFDLPPDLSVLFTLSLKELIYNGDKVNNFLIDTEIFNGSAIVHTVSAKLPGNAQLELVGNIDNNGIRPVFTGKFKSYGENFRNIMVWLYPKYSFIPEDELKEFLFSCDLNITPRIITISNMYGSVDRSLLNGSILLHPADVTPSITADMKIDKLDFDKYKITPQFDSFIKNFLATAKDDSIDTSWLKLFNYKLALSFTGDDITYNHNTLKNLSASLGIVKGVLGVQNLKIESEKLNLQGNLNINYGKQIPEINIDLTSNYLDTSSFILNDDTVKDVADKKNVPGSIWSKEPLNLMGIDRFGGNVNLAFSQLKHNNFLFKNMSLKGNLTRDVFSIQELKGTIGDKGKISVKGSIGVSREAPSVAVSVLGSDIEIQDLLQAMQSKSQTTGLLYFGGVMKTFGTSTYEWVNELKTNAKVSIRNAVISGLNLSQIIEQSRVLYSVIDMDVVTKEATASGTTKFTAIDGQVITDKSILQAKDFTLATEKSRGAFAGNASLHSLKMRGASKISYIPEFGKQVTLSFNIDGTLPDSINYTLDTNNLAQYITGKANR